MGKRFASLIVVACSVVGSSNAVAQAEPRPNEAVVGKPFVTCYGIPDHGGFAQNWALAQDSDGLIYLANGAGILQYDGATWRAETLPGRHSGRSLGVDPAGRVYAGSSGDLGYLTADEAGAPRFVSMLEHVPERDRDFTYVWTTLVRPEGVYFQTLERIFRFSPTGSGAGEDEWDVTVWQPEGQFGYAFSIGDEYYVHQLGVGLMQLLDDQLELVPDSEQFSSDRVHVLIPHVESPQSLLVGTFERGFFLFDGSRFEPWHTEVDDLLRDASLYGARQLADGGLLLGTLRAGALVVEPDGRLRYQIDASDGLAGPSAAALMVDREGSAWLASGQGPICRAKLSVSASRVDEASGLVGAVTGVERLHGSLYVTTSRGAYYQEAGANRMVEVEGIGAPRQAWALQRVDDSLLLAASTGLYQVTGRRAERVAADRQALQTAIMSLARSLDDPSRVYMGMFTGLASVRRDAAGTWVEEGRVAGVEGLVRAIVQLEPGTVWLSVDDLGVLRLTLRDGGSEVSDIAVFGPDAGIPAEPVHVTRIGDSVVANSSEGLHRFDEQSQRFVLDEELNKLSPDGLNWFFASEDEAGVVWVVRGREVVSLVPQDDGSRKAVAHPHVRLSDLPAQHVFTDRGGVVWFGKMGRLVRYEAPTAGNDEAGYRTLIRRVTAREEVLPIPAALSGDGQEPRIAHAGNTIRLEFAAPTYIRPTETVFRSRLDGFDNAWSAWTSERSRVYTNLPPGRYTFRVVARNLNGQESEAGAYTFTVLPPWYRTWFAYLIYGLLLGGAVLGADRVQRRRLTERERKRAEVEQAQLRAEAAELEARALKAENERKQLELEQARRLEQAYNELNEAHRRLKATQSQLIQQEKMASLGQLTAGIAHEIKNPLNFINNFAQLNAELVREALDAASETGGEALEELLTDIETNARKIAEHGKRADGIVRSMLAHSRKGSGKRQPTDLNALAEEFAGLAYHGMRAQRKDFESEIDVQLEPGLPTIPAVPEDLGRVLLNLLTNAFHAVHERGQKEGRGDYRPRVLIATGQVDDDVIVRVEDNGAGIPADARERIFEPFFTTRAAGEGTGLGLSLTHDIVVQGHGGDIDIGDAPGGGAVFTVRLPIGNP